MFNSVPIPIANRLESVPNSLQGYFEILGVIGQKYDIFHIMFLAEFLQKQFS